MTSPLQLSEGKLAAHLNSISDCVASFANSKVKLETEWNLRPLVIGLAGKGIESVERNRGKGTVAPLLNISKDLWAWFGYREEWAEERQTGSTKNLSFKSSAITIHFGYPGNIKKPQIFRAEWAGWARWNNADYSFMAGNAGHPHWQFDMLESLISEQNEAEIFLKIIKQEDDVHTAKDFIPSARTSNDVMEIIQKHEISKLHFASAATWWKGSPNDVHAHAPLSVIEIRSWVERTLTYICEELTRLQK